MRWPPPKPCLLGVTARPSVSPSSPAKSPPASPKPLPCKILPLCTARTSELVSGWVVRGAGRGRSLLRLCDLPVRRGLRHLWAHHLSCGRWALAPGPVSGTQQSLHKYRRVSFFQQHTVTGCPLHAKHREGCWGPKTAVCVVVSTQVPRSDSLHLPHRPCSEERERWSRSLGQVQDPGSYSQPTRDSWQSPRCHGAQERGQGAGPRLQTSSETFEAC